MRGVAMAAQMIVWASVAYAGFVVLALRGIHLPAWLVAVVMLLPLLRFPWRGSRRRFGVALALGFGTLWLAFAATLPPAHAAGLQGRWLTQNRQGVIAIGPCPANAGQGLCGRIAGADNPAARNWAGGPQCNLVILRSVAQTAPNHWTAKITDPRDGKVYDAEMRITPRGNLALRGYVALPLFGSTQIWTPFHGAIGANCSFR